MENLLKFFGNSSANRKKQRGPSAGPRRFTGQIVLSRNYSAWKSIDTSDAAPSRAAIASLSTVTSTLGSFS